MLYILAVLLFFFKNSKRAPHLCLNDFFASIFSLFVNTAQINAVGTKIKAQNMQNRDIINPNISPFNEKSLVYKFKDDCTINSKKPSNVSDINVL